MARRPPLPSREQVSQLSESLALNKANKNVYHLQKKDKFCSKVFSPPSIVLQLKHRSHFLNNPEMQESRFKKDYLDPPVASPLKAQESNKKNQLSQSYQKIDLRPKALSQSANIINWTRKDRPVSLNNFQVRLMTGILDSTVGTHFSKDFAANIQQLPSLFKRSNGEFTSYASAVPSQKLLQCKNFSPAGRA